MISPILKYANWWWGPKGCAVITFAGVGQERCCFMEFCYFGNAGDEGDWGKQADVNDIREHFKTWDVTLNELLKYVDSATVLRLAYTNQEIPWVHQGDKVLLIGDAVHALLPHTGI